MQFFSDSSILKLLPNVFDDFLRSTTQSKIFPFNTLINLACLNFDWKWNPLKTFFFELSLKNCKSLYIPEGFAHAYYSFSNLNIIYYKLSNYYHPEYEDGILWNDKLIKAKWPTYHPVVSSKDKKLKTFLEFKRIYNGL